MSDVDLSLATRDEMLSELCKRYDGFVFITCRELSDDDEERVCDFHGFPTRAVGLAHAAVAYLTAHLENRIRYTDTKGD